MANQIQEYHAPADWASAQQILARGDRPSVALFLSPRPQSLEDWTAEAVVDLSKLGLDTIVEENGCIKIGILTSMQQLVDSSVLNNNCYGFLSRCAHLAGTLGLRHYASLGGLLCDPTAPPETVLALLALDAQVLVRTLAGSDRLDDLADFLAGKVALQRGDVPFEVRLPHTLAGTLAMERVARTPRDLAIVAAVACIEVKDGLLSDVRVAVSGAFAGPQRVESVEKQLSGCGLSPLDLEKAAAIMSAAAAPLGDLRGSADYRKAMAGVVVRRAVAAAARQA
jgi:CO/xanthine dehydrogenase FAD-binding subunit